MLKVGLRPQNTIFGSVLSTILAVSKKLIIILVISLIQKYAKVGERWYKKNRIMKNLIFVS